MRFLLLLSAMIFVACAKPSSQSAQPMVDSMAVSPQKEEITCNVIDTCTYSGGLFPRPVFNCVAKTYQAEDHPELAQYFAGKSCLTTREDYQARPQWCHSPAGSYPCSVQVQGPGPAAIPGL